MRRRRFLAGTLLPLAILVAGACGATEGGFGGGGGGGGGGGATVDATLKDFAIALDPATVDAGEVTFDIRNDGPSEHEFVVVETSADVAPGDLPTKDGAVNEDGLDVVDEAEAIAPGDTADLTVDLSPGTYIVFCNIDGHYLSGMHAALTVR
jgi:uncharacterized cupredoxin-like copper-binding protein